MFAPIACLLFLLSAAVQWNDPDPLRWILIYATAAMLFGMSMFITIRSFLFVLLAAVAGLWAAILLPDILSTGSFTGTEEEREFLGLALVTIASLIQWRMDDTRRRAAPPTDH
jgi:hypothetical protein